MFPNPIQHLAKQATHHESSRLRVRRDEDNPERAWKKSQQTQTQTSAILQSVEQLQRQLNRLRIRRHMGDPGGTSTPSAGGVYRGEWDYSAVYEAQEIVSRGGLGDFISLVGNNTGNYPEAGAPNWHSINNPMAGVWG